ncbi:MAG: pyrroloquinoline quinone precursor peptide PqqA [Burkholderiales bacterium]|nr:pyrroloquinoline quinone precursor peptide PqqA [Burkholderiales bacterium]
MRHGIRRSPRRPSGGRATRHLRRLPMQWQTPTAQDFRFGFEITLYVSAR